MKVQELSRSTNVQPKSYIEKVTGFRWVVLAMAVMMCIVSNSDRANFGVALPFIRKEIIMTNTEAGAVMSLFFFGYAVMQIPGGFLNSRFGMPKTLSISIIVTSIFTAALAFASSKFQLQALRLAIGLAEGPTIIGLMAIINNWFPAKEKGTATGIYLAGTKVGPLIVPPICALVLSIWGWHQIFLVFAIPGILIGIVWYFMVSNHPSESSFCSSTEAEYIRTGNTDASLDNKAKRPYKLRWLDKAIRARKLKPMTTISQLFRSWNLIGDALAFAYMSGLVIILMSWLPSYLISVKKLSTVNMAFVTAAPFAGTVVGNVVGGWIADNLLNKRRKPMMMLSALATSFMMYLLIFAPSQPTLLAGILFVTGVLIGLGYSQFCAYPMGLVTKEKFPVAYGIYNTSGQVAGGVAPLAVGMILDRYNWDLVFGALGVGAIVCFLLVLSIIEPVDDPLV